MRYARILINFTEQVLAVDELKWPSPKVFETDRFKEGGCFNRHCPYYFGVAHAARVSETLCYASTCPGARHNKLHFIELKVRCVIDVNRVLIREKRAERVNGK
jgi:hypothetical protein